MCGKKTIYMLLFVSWVITKHGTGLQFLQTHYYLNQNICISMWMWGVEGHVSYIIKLVASHINAVASSALLVSQL